MDLARKRRYRTSMRAVTPAPPVSAAEVPSYALWAPGRRGLRAELSGFERRTESAR